MHPIRWIWFRSKHLARVVTGRNILEPLCILVIIGVMFTISLICSQFVYLDSDDVASFDHTPIKSSIPSVGRVALVLVAHDRPDEFRQTFSSVLKARRFNELDLIVSMDFPPAYKTLRSLTMDMTSKVKELGINPIFWKNPTPGYGIRSSDLLITQHHRKIFDRGFIEAGYDYLILLETDLTVSEDIFEYFLQAAPILQTYPIHKPPPTSADKRKFFCVSAWNDNGMDYHTLSESRLTRTDFFPGLGWMIHKSTWTEVLRHEWPPGHAYYDDWIRERSSVRTYDCLVPEVSRTHHIARYGVHVRADPWYDHMVLASGHVAISQSEYTLVADSAQYRNRILAERIENARIIKWDGQTNIDIPYNQSIVIVFSPPFKSIESLNDMFGFFHRGMRNSFAGLMTAQLGEQHGRTNVTLVYEPNAAWWGIDVSRIL